MHLIFSGMRHKCSQKGGKTLICYTFVQGWTSENGGIPLKGVKIVIISTCASAFWVLGMYFNLCAYFPANWEQRAHFNPTWQKICEWDKVYTCYDVVKFGWSLLVHTTEQQAVRILKWKKNVPFCVSKHRKTKFRWILFKRGWYHENTSFAIPICCSSICVVPGRYDLWSFRSVVQDSVSHFTWQRSYIYALQLANYMDSSLSQDIWVNSIFYFLFVLCNLDQTWIHSYTRFDLHRLNIPPQTHMFPWLFFNQRIDFQCHWHM